MCLFGNACIPSSGEVQITTGTTIQLQLDARMAGTECESKANQLEIGSQTLTICLPELLGFPRRSALSHTIVMVDITYFNLVPYRNLEPPNGAIVSLPPPHPDPFSILKRLLVFVCTGLTPLTQCLWFGGFTFTSQKIVTEFWEHLYLTTRQPCSQRQTTRRVVLGHYFRGCLVEARMCAYLVNRVSTHLVPKLVWRPYSNQTAGEEYTCVLFCRWRTPPHPRTRTCRAGSIKSPRCDVTCRT